MRFAAVLLVGSMLAVAPAAAEAKTKPAAVAEPSEPAVANADAVSVQAFNACLGYAKGDVLAGEAAKQQGWETYDDGGESPYVQSYSGSKSFEAVGDANLFSLVESYPDTTFGYCRVDMDAPSGDAGVNALRDLPALTGGQMTTNGDGTFGSWKGAEAEPQLLLLSHQTAEVFVLQLTIITHRDGATDAK